MENVIDIYGKYAPAYTISNESQRWATCMVPNVRRVLTVAGSGDQALFYKLAGAKTVHTFDRTQNARVIQDIKFTAIKNIEYFEYSNLLTDLYYSADIMKIPTMQKIAHLLPRKTVEIINTPGNKHVFGAGLDARNYPENIPSPLEYEQLKQTLKRPFNFVCADLYDLSVKMSGEYDLINISNIFDYCYDSQTRARILYNLATHLRVGGHIVYLPQNTNPKCDGFAVFSKKCKLEHMKSVEKDRSSKMLLFQRTR